MFPFQYSIASEHSFGDGQKYLLFYDEIGQEIFDTSQMYLVLEKRRRACGKRVVLGGGNARGFLGVFTSTYSTKINVCHRVNGR